MTETNTAPTTEQELIAKIPESERAQIEAQNTPPEPTPAEPTKTEEPVKTEPQAPPFDPEKFKQEVTEVATKQALEQFIKQMTGKTESQTTKDSGIQSPWAKEGRQPKDWDEVLAWNRQVMRKEDEEIKKAQEAEQAKATEAQKQAQEAAQKEAATKYQAQLSTLQTAGKIPKGEAAIKDFWKQVTIVAKKLQDEGKPPVQDVNEFYTFHYKAPKEIPGADAPIAGKSSTPNESSKKGYSHSKIRNMSIHQLAQVSK